MTADFIERLKRLCVEHPTRAKWVFVRSHAAGHTMGDRLVLEGTDWANLRFVTPLDIALRMGAPFLVERGVDPSEEGLGPALVMRLLLDLPDGTSYFRPLADQPQMAMALWSTLRELRMAGVRAADLPAGAFASADKHSEICALLDAYERFLVQESRGDRATVFEEALAHPDWCPVQPQDCWTEFPDVTWSPLERRLLAAIPGKRVIDPVAGSATHFSGAIDPLPGSVTPISSGAPIASDAIVPGGLVIDASPAPSPSPAPRARLRTFGASGRQVPSQPPVFFHAGGLEAEVEEVFRRILGSGAPLDTVEIACASDRYAALIWEKAVRYNWPVTLASGIPATLTRPGRALLGLVEWIEDNFAAGRLRRLLQSGDITLGDKLAIAPGRAARLLVKAQAAWGRETYRRALGRAARSASTRATRDDIPPDERDRLLASAQESESLAAWIAAIIDSVPQPGTDGRIALAAIVSCGERFVMDASAKTSALDHAAATRLGRAIGELRMLGDFHCSIGQALRFIRERVETLSVGADRPRPGHLHVSSLRESGLAGRAHLFAVGLEEGRVFPAAFEDPILLDSERAGVHPGLRLSTDALDEAVRAVRGNLRSAMAAPDVALCLSYSCRDLREFRETYASWVMLDMFREATNDRTKSYRDLHEHLGAPVSCVSSKRSGVPVDGPEDDPISLSVGRWWLQGVTRAGEAAGRTAVTRQFPALAAGLAAEAARASALFTEFDGHVPAAGAVLDPCAADVIVSPTQLEEAAECPFRYFLRRGLQVNAIESGERDRDLWLNPLIRGSILHDLYAGLLRRCRDAGRKPSAKQDQAWFVELGQMALDDLERDMPPPSLEVKDRETRDFIADLELFLENEIKVAPLRTPVGLEVAFGRARGDADAEPLSIATPVTVQVGGLTFRVAGRVDRIDELTDGTFEILDYKTGGYWPDKWKGTFAGGRRLQHALYGLAALELLKKRTATPKVAAAQYYFSSTKGRLERKTIPAATPAAVGQVLSDLRDVITSGLFVHTPTEGDCRFCDYGPACGANAHTRGKAKLGDTALAQYNKLAAHE